MKNRWRVIALVALFMAVLFVIAWESVRPRDPLFHGKRESEWIAGLTYFDEKQVPQWREFGEDGVQLLIRALDGANRPGDRAYRKAHRGLSSLLPQAAMQVLPAPRRDLERATRMKVVDLLARLSKDAKQAMPIMIRTLQDEDANVRQIAVTYFTSGENEHCLVNELEPREKERMLPIFLQLMKDTHWGVRNNTLIALRFFPEAKDRVVPVLERAMKDDHPNVRRLAFDTLQRVDAARAKRLKEPIDLTSEN